MTYFSFYISLLTLLFEIYSVYRFYTDSCFSFSTLKMSHHSLFTCIVSNEKSAVILIFVPLYIIHLLLKFSLCHCF